MEKSKKIIAVILTALLIVSTMVTSAAAYASDNSYPFSFATKGNKQRTYSQEYYYRGATTDATPWMVKYTFSSEGEKTIMEFCLVQHTNKDNKVSNYKQVTQGSGTKYFQAYDEACEIDVHLGARNNNNTNHKYEIAGYWDEETAKHDFSY